MQRRLGQCCEIASDGPRKYHSIVLPIHESLPRTIEELWGLERLGHSSVSDVRSVNREIHEPTVHVTPAHILSGAWV